MFYFVTKVFPKIEDEKNNFNKLEQLWLWLDNCILSGWPCL